MKKESRPLNSLEQENLFGEWCKDNNIKKFLFDLDDTICATRKIFQDFTLQACDFLADNAPEVSREVWKNEVTVTNDKLFEKFGVTPKRWDFLADELTEKYSLTEMVKEKLKQIFGLIYETPLSMLEGAQEGLSFVRAVGIPIGIVTHANSEWTLKKYNWLDLKRFVDWKDVFLVDENGHKTSESWEAAIRYFEVNPSDCAVVGDSPRSDINPARRVGVKHCFLVEDENQWSVHHQPVDGVVIKIRRLDQIGPAALKATGL